MLNAFTRKWTRMDPVFGKPPESVQEIVRWTHYRALATSPHWARHLSRETSECRPEQDFPFKPRPQQASQLFLFSQLLLKSGEISSANPPAKQFQEAEICQQGCPSPSSHLRPLDAGKVRGVWWEQRGGCREPGANVTAEASPPAADNLLPG